MRETANLFGVSAVIGLAGTLAGMRLMRSMLFGIAPWDASIALAALLAFAMVAGLAAWLPAHRAARLHPMDALRQE